MTIAIVTDKYPPMIGGAGAVMHSLALHAPDQIEIVTCEYDGNGKRIEPSGAKSNDLVRVHRTPRFQRRLNWLPPGRARAVSQALFDRFVLRPNVSQQFFRVVEPLDPDVICIGTPGCWWLVNHIRERRPHAKVVFYVHGEEVPHGNSYHSRLSLMTLRQATAVVAVSSFTKNAVVEAGIPEDRVVVITNGVDTTRFRPGSKSESIVARYGLASRRVLLTLARLDERKGQDMMLRALPIIREAIPDVAYLVVGEGDYGDRLRTIASELQLEGNLVFTGAASDDEVQDFYRTCDVYAMPNRTTATGDTEGFGLVFLEAGACGKAVIGGNAGGVPDAIKHGVTGLIVDGKSITEIAHACIRLLQDADLRNRFGSNGLANAHNNEWREKARQFVSFCSSIDNEGH